jgi:rSAM/selenodomain-associated transferase 2
MTSTRGGAAMLSVIVPALNEEAALGATLERAVAADRVELIVVDGGSTDGTTDVASRHGATVLRSAPGRAVQMNAGAAGAAGDLLLFLHADTLLPRGYAGEVRRLLADRGVAAGAFRLRIAGRRPALRLIEHAVNLRSRCLSLPYGDQALFMTRTALRAAGGFPPLPVMEDFALVRRLRSVGRIALARLAVETSARRWNRDGPWRTTLRNQLAIAAFLGGVRPARIARFLGRSPQNESSGRTLTTSLAVGQPSSPSTEKSIDRVAVVDEMP